MFVKNILFFLRTGYWDIMSILYEKSNCIVLISVIFDILSCQTVWSNKIANWAPWGIQFGVSPTFVVARALHQSLKRWNQPYLLWRTSFSMRMPRWLQMHVGPLLTYQMDPTIRYKLLLMLVCAEDWWSC